MGDDIGLKDYNRIRILRPLQGGGLLIRGLHYLVPPSHIAQTIN